MADMKEIEEDIYRYAVKNAFLHNGKADSGAVVGKIMALHRETAIMKIMPAIERIVNEVNAMPLEEIEGEYKKFEKKGYELKAKEKPEGLPKLEWAEGKGAEKVVTRYAPNPNGPFHLGNARAAILSEEYARMYSGKFLLRFDDTDPKVKKPIENAEAIFREDLEWLKCKVDEVCFASDRLELYYKYMKKVIELGKAYVCVCDTEAWRKKIKAKKACTCREKDKKEQGKMFDRMLKHEFKEGQAVLRIKTELKHKDPSMRDWWAAKIVDRVEHPNKKALDRHVWPSYNFASAIDDHELGVTYIIRGQEHAQNEEKQKFLYSYFKWEYPHSFHFGRIKLGGMLLSTSKIKEGIEKGIYSGWDDPRLGTIRALRRRGFDARALRKVILDIGMKPNDAAIEESALIAENKRFIDKEAERIVFVQEPVIMDVHYTKAVEAELPKHPDFPERGVKKYSLHEGQQRFILDRKEVERFKEGETIRLKKAYNVRIGRKDAMQIFAEFVSETKADFPVVHWLLEEESAGVEIVMPDNARVYGSAEKELERVGKGRSVQLESFGYARVDGAEKGNINLWFTHK